MIMPSTLSLAFVAGRLFNEVATLPRLAFGRLGSTSKPKFGPRMELAARIELAPSPLRGARSPMSYTSEEVPPSLGRGMT